MLLKLTLVIMLLTFLTASSAMAEEKKMTEDEILAGANERIEQNRKADVVVQVVDKNGKPVQDAVVEIKQTRHSFLFGCNAFGLGYYKDEQLQTYKKRFSDLLNYATLPFYWGSYEPEKGKTNEDGLKKMATWCKANRITTKGHPLIWYMVFPKWGSHGPDEAKAEQKARIEDIVPAFKGLIDRWDVVNEATKWDPKEHDNGVSAWLLKDGPINAVDQALDWAHEANPKAFLLYNDWNVSPEYEKMAQDLIKMKAPVDAFGIQSHMHNGEWPIERVWSVCETYSRFKKPLHFTELTVLSGEHGWMKPAPWPTTPEGEANQAIYVEKIYTVLFSHPSVEAITWWDLEDGQWMGAPAGLIRKDLTPKPAYDRLMELIKGKWWTDTKLTTDRQGKCGTRGFLGDYDVIVSTPEQKTVKSLQITRGDNVLKIVIGDKQK